MADDRSSVRPVGRIGGVSPGSGRSAGPAGPAAAAGVGRWLAPARGLRPRRAALRAPSGRGRAGGPAGRDHAVAHGARHRPGRHRPARADRAGGRRPQAVSPARPEPEARRSPDRRAHGAATGGAPRGCGRGRRRKRACGGDAGRGDPPGGGLRRGCDRAGGRGDADPRPRQFPFARGAESARGGPRGRSGGGRWSLACRRPCRRSSAIASRHGVGLQFSRDRWADLKRGIDRAAPGSASAIRPNASAACCRPSSNARKSRRTPAI
jgi:hypothetical protein